MNATIYETAVLDEQRRADQHEIDMLLNSFSVHEYSCKSFPSGTAYSGEARISVTCTDHLEERIVEAAQWGLFGPAPDIAAICVQPEGDQFRVWFIAPYPDQPEEPEELFF